MIVSLCLAIVTAGAIAKSHFTYQTCLFQVPQRIVDSGETDSRHRFAGRLKYFGGGRMGVAGADNVEHGLSLTRQDGPVTWFVFNRFLPAAYSHAVIIIILIIKSRAETNRPEDATRIRSIGLYRRGFSSTTLYGSGYTAVDDGYGFSEVAFGIHLSPDALVRGRWLHNGKLCARRRDDRG
jgi:hypothetical protein